MKKRNKRPDIPTVRLIDSGYSPSREELAEDLRVNATLEELGKAVTRTVNVEFYKPRRKRR